MLCLQFGSQCIGSTIRLSCSTWEVGDATISYTQAELGYCPNYVLRAQDALGFAKGGPPSCTLIAN